MCAAIETPGKCEICTVICFLQAEGHSAAEIHLRMSAVYRPNFMCDKCVWEWRRKFRNVWTDTHDEGGQGRPSLVTDELVQHIDKVVRERRRFTISEHSVEFPQVCRMVLYEIVTQKNLATTSFVPDGCHKCSLMFTKHKEWRQLWCFCNIITMRGKNFLTRLWQTIKHGLSLSMWKPKSSLNNGCTHIHRINPGNSNNHWQTESWRPQCSGTEKECCWTSLWNLEPR